MVKRKTIDKAKSAAKTWEGYARVAILYVVAATFALCVKSELSKGASFAEALRPCCAKYASALSLGAAKAEGIPSDAFRMADDARITGWTTNGGASWTTAAPEKWRRADGS